MLGRSSYRSPTRHPVARRIQPEDIWTLKSKAGTTTNWTSTWLTTHIAPIVKSIHVHYLLPRTSSPLGFSLERRITNRMS